jgi:hypothetical protein
MLKDLTPENALIFRITHMGNIAQVLSEGCRCRASVQSSHGYVEIGNQELIDKRKNRLVPCGPLGTLSDYVPFYFTPYSPMLYNIKTGFGVPKKPMSEIVLLVSSLPHLVKAGIPFVFTDRHAYLKTAQFSNSLSDLNWIIWPTLQVRDFKKDDADKFEKYQAEALVYRHVPMDGLLGIACYNEAARATVQAEADKYGCSVKIRTRPDWYL